MANIAKVATITIALVILLAVAITIVQAFEESCSEDVYNTGDAGIPLAKYESTTLPNDPVVETYAISTYEAGDNKMLRVVCSGTFEHDFEVLAVDQIVLITDQSAVYVHDSNLYFRDINTGITTGVADTLNIEATVDASSGIGLTVNGGYSPVESIYMPDPSGEFASYHGYSYEFEPPVSAGTWEYGDHVWTVQSVGTDMFEPSLNLHVVYVGGWSGSGIKYVR